MNIVFLVFGTNITYHLQTLFSILTVLKHKREDDTVTLYTDSPQYYQRLNQEVMVSLLDKDTISKWINGTNYIFRAKIKAIEHCAHNNPDRNLLFLDSDTILYNDGLSVMEAMMNEGKGIMYVDEGHPSAMRGKSLKMWQTIKGKAIDGCTVSMKHNVWNSGVIGIPREKKESVIALALKICDAILAENVGCFTAEQYAFSIAMQEHCGMCDATRWIGHYWGNKQQWHDIVAHFFLESYIKGRTVAEELDCIDSLRLNDTPLMVRKPNTQRRLVNLVNKIFPDEIIL